MVKKRCAKCLVEQMVPERQRRCHIRAFGPASYCCWGTLTRVAKPARAPRAAPTPQEQAMQALGRLSGRRAEVVRQLAKLAKRLHAMGLQEARLAKKAAMSDEALAADRAKRQAAREKGKTRRRRRAMEIGGEVP